jgi:chromosomal replication initiation ATPase DnaA
MTSIRSIQREVCAAHGISLQDMIGPSHKQIFVRPRREAMAKAFAAGNGYSKIGRSFNRTHSTVIASVRKLANGPA